MAVTLGVVFVASVMVMLVVLLAIRQFGGAYNRRVLEPAAGELEDAFVFIAPRNLRYAAVGITILACGAGYALMNVPGLIIGLISGVLAVPLVIKRMRARRRDQFIYQLPDALLALAGAMQAGATVVRGIELVATRQPKPISEEFRLVLSEYRMGRDLEQSLAGMKSRMECEELELLTAAVQVSRTVGGNLAQSLEALAYTLRSKAQVEGKVRALTAMGKMQGWVLSMLPLFVGWALYLQRPEQMALLFTTGIGWLVTLFCAFLMSCAVLSIRKIVNIDV